MRSSAEQAKFRKAVFLAHKQNDENGRIFLTCHICGGRIDPATEGWEASHLIPHAWGGKEGAPAHIKCHKRQTAEQDIPAIAKSKRVSDKHYGIKRKGWGNRFKKKMSGEVVER